MSYIIGASKRDTNFRTFIYKVLKQVHPDMGISSNASITVNNIILTTIKRIADTINITSLIDKKRTVTSRAVQTAVLLVLPVELGKHAFSEGIKAVTKYNASVGARTDYDRAPRGGARSKPQSRSARSGLQFSVPRVKKLLRHLITAPRVGNTAAVFLAAVLEYLAAEIVELAGNAARDNNAKRIVPRHLMLAIRNDEPLNYLYSRHGTIVLGGGVIQNIHNRLLPKNQKEPLSSL